MNPAVFGSRIAKHTHTARICCDRSLPVFGAMMAALAATTENKEQDSDLAAKWSKLPLLSLSSARRSYTINVIRGDLLRGGIGVVIAGLLMLYLLSPRLRAAFV
jgi:hypothetical protein